MLALHLESNTQKPPGRLVALPVSPARLRLLAFGEKPWPWQSSLKAYCGKLLNSPPSPRDSILGHVCFEQTLNPVRAPHAPRARARARAPCCKPGHQPRSGEMVATCRPPDPKTNCVNSRRPPAHPLRFRVLGSRFRV